MLSVNDKLSNTDGIGIGRKGTIDKPQFLKAPFWTVDTLFYLTSLPNHDLLFWYYVMQNINWKRFDESTGVPSLSKKTIEGMTISVPDKEEQKLIGEFFKKIDYAINLHQRKINILESLKQQYFSLMFPKNNKNIPELSFKNFKAAWEQHKAKKIFNSVVEKGREELPVLSVTQNNGVVYRSDVGIDIKYNPKTLNSYKVIHPGDFVISLRSFQGGFELSDKLGIASPAYTIIIPKEKDSHDNFFWKMKFKTFNFVESLKTVTFGIRDGKSISFSEFGDLKLTFPSLEEQQKLGLFFKQLGDTITLHQRKLSKLKKLKQVYLNKMFI